MRIASTLASLSCVLAACGGKGHPASTLTNTGTGAGTGSSTAPAATGGTTGFEGVSWGDHEDALFAAYPALDHASRRGPYRFEDRPATLEFQLTNGGVVLVEITGDEIFPDMGACLAVWKAMRPKLDARWGHSQAENGAAYWASSTAEITVACNPIGDDGDAARLFVVFTPPTPLE